jgi:hypothetical protein
MAWKRRWSPEAVTAEAAAEPMFLALPVSAGASPGSDEPRVALKISRHQGSEASWSIEAELSLGQWPWAFSLLNSPEAS